MQALQFLLTTVKIRVYTTGIQTFPVINHLGQYFALYFVHEGFMIKYSK